MSEPRESRVSYLRRVLPDLPGIERSVRDALLAAEHGDSSDYDLGHAVSKTQKLLEDLQRALHAA